MDIKCSVCGDKVDSESEEAFGMLKILYWDIEEKKFVEKLILCPKCQTNIMSNEGYEKLWGEIECR